MTTRNTALLAAGLAAALSSGCSSYDWRNSRGLATDEAQPLSAARPAPRSSPTPQMQAPPNDPLALSISGIQTPMRARTAGFSTAMMDLDGAPPPSTASMQPEALSRSGFGDTHGPGGNLSQITFALDGADFDPDVSHDGSRIVFASTQHRVLSDIYIKDVGSRVVTQLTNEPAHDVMPKISPDGTRVAFASNRSGAWNIYVMPITGGRAIQITSGTADDLHPSWSPDSTQLVFCRLGEVSGQWELWVTEVANNGIARYIGNGLFPQWCPVGGSGANGADKIAFQRSRERGDRSFSIWTIDYKRGQAFNATEIASSPTGACINPSWSPDGQWIAYAQVPNPGQWAQAGRPPSADLYLVDLSGSNRVSLTSGVGVNLMPTWAGNNRLFFVSNRAGVENVWAMDTTSVMQLAQSNSRPTATYATPGGESRTPVVNVPAEGGSR